MDTRPLPGNFGIEIADLDLREMADADYVGLLSLLYGNRFVAIKTDGIEKQDYVKFARQLGDPISLSRNAQYPEIAVISNLKADNKQSRLGAAHWHTDQSFRKVVSSITMLYSEQAPEVGGETKFCNMVAAYDALDSETQSRIEDLQVEHRHGVSISAPKTDHKPISPKDWDQSYTVYHPLVRRHPETGMKTLYGVTGSAQGIRGMSRKESILLLKDLTEHALQPQFVTSYRHHLHDIVMWDNPTVMHSATPIGEAVDATNTRVLLRISLRGSPPVLLRQRNINELDLAESEPVL